MSRCMSGLSHMATVSAAALAMLLLNGTARAGEGEYWASMTVGKRMGETRLILRVDGRARSGLTDDYYRSVSLGIDGVVGDHLKLGASYAHVASGDDWDIEKRPAVDCTGTWRISGVRLSDRNRLEARLREDSRAVRYRNRLMVAFELRPGGTALSLYNEVFTNALSTELQKNRLGCEMTATLSRGSSLGLFYLFESRDGPRGWSHWNVLGLSLTGWFE